MHTGRREFLSGLAAAGAVALVPDILKGAQAPAAGPVAARRIIDTHYHYASPAYSEVLRPMGTGQTGLIEWNETKALEDMDKRWRRDVDPVDQRAERLLRRRRGGARARAGVQRLRGATGSGSSDTLRHVRDAAAA